MRRESERKAAATAGHIEKEDGTRVKIKESGPTHTEGDINTSFAFINGDGTLNSADITSPANRTCGQAQGPFRSTRRIAAMALQKKQKTAKRKLRSARGLPGAASARARSKPASAGTCQHMGISAYIRVYIVVVVLCKVAIHGHRIGNLRSSTTLNTTFLQK